MVTKDLQTSIRRCFECEAGGVRLALVIPEIYARDCMLGDPLFQVRVYTHLLPPSSSAAASSYGPMGCLRLTFWWVALSPHGNVELLAVTEPIAAIDAAAEPRRR